MPYPREAARDRKDSGDAGDGPGPPGRGQRHGDDQDVRREGNAGAFQEGDEGQPAERMAMPGEPDDPVTKAAEHAMALAWGRRLGDREGGATLASAPRGCQFISCCAPLASHGSNSRRKCKARLTGGRLAPNFPSPW